MPESERLYTIKSQQHKAELQGLQALYIGAADTLELGPLNNPRILWQSASKARKKSI